MCRVVVVLSSSVRKLKAFIYTVVAYNFGKSKYSRLTHLRTRAHFLHIVVHATVAREIRETRLIRKIGKTFYVIFVTRVP